MPEAARGWLAPALLGVGLITAARIALLALNRTDLFVDEAQYWLWGQELAFGYYSKPPLIGWTIRAFTEIGSDAPFWVRLPAPLLHGATALILGAAAARLAGARAAVVAALAYATLPMVAVASLLMSTDSVMFPPLAGAFLAWLGVLDRRRTGRAVLAGALLGVAFLGKYAAVYYILCAALAAALVPAARPGWRPALAGLAACAVVISPNVAWNLLNGLTTVQHTLDNADWVRDPGARAALTLSGLTEFVAAQFAVAGPVVFAALLAAAVGWRRRGPDTRLLLVFALPILLVVCVQAVLSQAYANWAAATYLTGSVAAVLWMLGRSRGWLIASFAVNGALCLLFPVAATMPYALTWNGQPLLERHIGRDAMSREILAIAASQRLDTIVASDRDVLANLFYTLRNEPVTLHALPAPGRAPHHYALRYPYPGGTGDVLLAIRAGDPVCEAAVKIADIAPGTGAFRRHPQAVYRAPPGCFAP